MAPNQLGYTSYKLFEQGRDGNSAEVGKQLGRSIPKAMAEQAGLAEGTQVSCELAGEEIVIRKQRPHYTLEELVEGMSPDNAHAELDWGSPVGQEHW